MATIRRRDPICTPRCWFIGQKEQKQHAADVSQLKTPKPGNPGKRERKKGGKIIGKHKKNASMNL
jgi:hypothetical protein